MRRVLFKDSWARRGLEFEISRQTGARTMRIVSSLSAGLAALLAWTSCFAAEFGWTISASSMDPYVNTASATGDIETYWLWYTCAIDCGNFCAAEAGLEVDGPSFVQFNGWGGFLNAGTAPDLLLTCSCFLGDGWSVLGSIDVVSLPGSIAIGPSSYGAGPVGVDCNPTGLAEIHPIEWIGLGIDQPPPTSGTPCVPNPVPTSATSWSRLKTLFR